MATAIGIHDEHSALRRSAERYSAIGLTIAVAFHFAGVGGYWFVKQLVGNDEVKIGTGRTDIGVIWVGASPIDQQKFGYTERVKLARTVAPDKGFPVIVPDAQVSPEKTIMDQNELRQISGQGTGDIGNGEGSKDGTGAPGFAIPGGDDNVPPPDTFRPFEKYPEIITQAKPEYPDIARQVGLQGKVIVKIWVDKHGVPRQAAVLKSDAEIFNNAAVDAAMRCRFTPAVMNKGPVSIWITIPFTFRLNQSQ